MSSGIVVVVSLYLHPGRAAEFDEFETHAARVIRAHDGRVEQVIRPTVSLFGEPLPQEIHIVSFPGMEHFAAYRSDPALAGFTALREQAIARTTVVVGEPIHP